MNTQNTSISIFKHLLFTFFMLITSIASSQTDVIFHDDYSTHNSIWRQYKKNANGSQITNGVYKISSTDNDALRWFGAQLFINYKKNFSIEAKMKQTAGPTNQGYGIMWGSKGWEYSYYFIVSSSGYYNVGKYYNSTFREIKTWTASDAINGMNEYNTLKIEKTDRSIVFYINNKAVFTSRFAPFYGQMQGFYLQSDIDVSVDHMTITNDLPAMQIADVNFSGVKKNIGSTINTDVTEIAPIISPDGQTLYFARGYDRSNAGGYYDEADIWYSKKQPDGSWGRARNIGYPLNNDGINVVVNATPDGNTLFLEGLYNSDGSFKSDAGISVTHKTSDGWSVPEKVRITNFYNDNQYETYFFTTDQKVLILAVERDDTYGDLDLYVSFRRSNGSYTEPKNMGAKLNTFGDEGTPFMSPDGVTLYFSTSGLRGYGSNDIYMTTRLDDTWLNWSTPKNLGQTINTNDWDTYLSLSARGDTAFLVSTSNSYGWEDIFTIELSPQMQPDPVVLISGKVLDNTTKRPIGATITYIDINSGQEVGIAQSNPTTGEYKIILPYGKFYSFRANASNYIAQSENIDLRNVSDYQEITRNLYLSRFQVGEVIVLNNVFFEQGESDLQTASHDELNRIVKIMQDNPTMKIELRGHTDNRGNAQLLMQLSQDRVNAVKDYLVSKGIAENRIVAKAFGGTQPINLNDTENEHAKNRRVEFKILSM